MTESLIETQQDNSSLTSPQVEGSSANSAEPSIEPPAEGIKENATEELLAGKYKTVEDLESGYNNLNKLYREAKDLIPKAPEDGYVFDFSESPKENLRNIKLEADDPMLKSLQPIWQKYNLPQDAVTEMMEQYFETELSMLPNKDDELKKLGNDQQEVVAKISKVANSISDESLREEYLSLTSTAQGARLAILLSNMSGEKSIPGSGAPVPTKTAQEYKDEAFKYKKDNENSISMSRQQQAHYKALLRKATELELQELDS